jgi:HK97 gp10 family phage protein
LARWIKAELKNRAALTERLNKLVPNADAELAKAQLAAGIELADDIRARAPVRRGDYRASIHAARMDEVTTGRGNSAFGKTKDPNAVGIYAWFVWRFIEFGTVKTPAHPHVLPTYRASRKKIKAQIRAALKRAIQESK